MPDRLLLVGMMGAGKTTVGRVASVRLGWEYLDSDAQVVAVFGRSVPEIFAHEGEAAFRVMESQVLSEALSSPSPMVLSVAGGAVLSEANRALILRSGVVVWLRATPVTLAARVGSGKGRPLLGEHPEASLSALDQVRRPLYESVAHAVVDVDDLTLDEVVDRVLARAGLVVPGGDRS